MPQFTNPTAPLGLGLAAREAAASSALRRCIIAATRNPLHCTALHALHCNDATIASLHRCIVASLHRCIVAVQRCNEQRPDALRAPESADLRHGSQVADWTAYSAQGSLLRGSEPAAARSRHLDSPLGLDTVDTAPLNPTGVTMRNVHLIVACAVLLGVAPPEPRTGRNGAGPNRDGKVDRLHRTKTWPKELNKTWKVTVGDGVATPALVGDKLYVFSREGGDEIVRCLNAADGKEVWKEKYASPGFRGPDACSWARAARRRWPTARS